MAAAAAAQRSQQEYVYVIECAGGKYYVGRTREPRRRLEQHRGGDGAEWTRLHRPLRFAKLQLCHDPLEEDELTYRLMREHGIENVRGGSYSQPQLDRATVRVLTRKLYHAGDGCLRCGHSGHYINGCYATRDIQGNVIDDEDDASSSSSSSSDSSSASDDGQCFRCGRSGHWAAECYARSDAHGVPLDSGSSGRSIGRGEHSETRGRKRTRRQSGGDECYRCGRSGHWESECYARTDIDGDRL